MVGTVFDPAPRIADETKLPLAGIRSVIRLIGDGATVPFIARYRKEQTGGLDELQIRAVEEKAAYLTELDARRRVVLSEIASQGKLTPELAAKIENCWVKAAIEDAYLPFKPKRRTRAAIARERGLEPLAALILAQTPTAPAQTFVAQFVDPAKNVPDVTTALAGARDIVAETVADRSDVRAFVRDVFKNSGLLVSRAAKGKVGQPTKFDAYYDFQEKARSIPSHRFLAIRRGAEEGVLRLSIDVDKPAIEARIAVLFQHRARSPFSGELTAAIEDAVARLLCPSIEAEVLAELKVSADRDAVAVFAENLAGLLLAPALGRKAVIGIDPGQRTGCKCAVVDDTGKFVSHAVLHLVSGDGALARAREVLLALLTKHAPFAIAVGNGTHGRETADFCRDAVKSAGMTTLVVMVSESGASVYSASDIARDEFPDLDLTIRGAISIARRLQDPLAELVKIDPKAIGVGQYQHDVHQPTLKRKLDDVVESCVNAVGVELNTASAPLLSRVAGLGSALAKRIVVHRDAKGAFKSRQQLLDVPGLGPKAFEQCAGFIRIRSGTNPLDASAVHPERYSLVARIAAEAGVDLDGAHRPSRGRRKDPLVEVRVRRGRRANVGRHPGGTRETRARPPRGVRSAGLSRRCAQARGPRPRNAARRHCHERDRLRGFRRCRRTSGRARPRLAARGPIRPRPTRSRQSGRHDPRARARRGSRAKAHRAERQAKGTGRPPCGAKNANDVSDRPEGAEGQKQNYTTLGGTLYPRRSMNRVTVRRRLLFVGLLIALTAVAAGCPKKQPALVEDAEAPPPPSAPTITEIAPLTDTTDASDAATEAAAPKKWVGPAVTPNQSKLAACCAAMRTQAKQMGQSPEVFQLNAAAVQCDVFVKQVGPMGTAPEFAQVRQLLKSIKLPSACQF